MSIECPYCDAELDDPEDCYEEDVPYDHTCPECEKTFAFDVIYSRDYNTRQADCLNGGQHRYQARTRYGLGGAPHEVLVCQDCWHENINQPGSGAL